MSRSEDEPPRHLRAVPGNGDVPPDPADRRPATPRSAVVDINSAARERLHGEIRKLEATNGALVSIAKANLAAQAQTHNAVLAVLEAENLAGLDKKLAARVPGALNLSIVRVFIEGHAPLKSGESIIGAAPGLGESLLGDQPVKLGPVDRRFADALYAGEAGRVSSEALVRLDIAGRSGLLAMAARDKTAFSPDQGSDLVHFFARVIERQLAHFLRNG